MGAVSGWGTSTVSIVPVNVAGDAALNGCWKPWLPGLVSPGRAGRLGIREHFGLFAATQHCLLASRARLYV